MFQYMNVKKYVVRFADKKWLTVYDTSLENAIVQAHEKHAKKLHVSADHDLVEHVSARRI